MPRKQQRKNTLSPSELIDGKDLPLNRWIELLLSDQARNVFPNNCFPTDEMKNEYISNIKDVDEKSFKNLLRCFLKKSGSYGVDNTIFDSMIKNNTLKELTSEFEFHRRLLGGAAWEGNTWILDLLPNHPIRAVQALEAYQTAHIGLYTDHMLYGSYDAIELVRTRYNLPREATPMSSLMQSTFLSYGGPDEGFARKLYEALQRSGVPTFFFPEHAEPGEKLHRLMRNKVNEQDRIILVCSKNSLDRKGVLNEIEEVLIREANDGGASYLIPIRLDGYIFDGWHPPNADVALAVRAKVVANFEGTEGDHFKFEAALQRLLKALEKKVFPAT